MVVRTKKVSPFAMFGSMCQKYVVVTHSFSPPLMMLQMKKRRREVEDSIYPLPQILSSWLVMEVRNTARQHHPNTLEESRFQRDRHQIDRAWSCNHVSVRMIRIYPKNSTDKWPDRHARLPLAAGHTLFRSGLVWLRSRSPNKAPGFGRWD